MRLTWYGRGTWLVDVDGTTFLTDPYFDPAYTDVRPADLAPPDYVLVTHAHWSRLEDLDAFTESTVVANTELVNYLSRDHALGSTHVLNLGGTLDAGDAHVLMQCAEHAHGVKRGSYVDTPYEENTENVGLAVGYVVTDTEPTNRETPGAETVYLTGETQLLSEMRDFVGPYLGPQVVCLPVAETPDVGRSTMPPWQAAIAVDWLGVDYVCPMVAPDARDAGDQFRDELVALDCDADVVDLDPGETFDLTAALET